MTAEQRSMSEKEAAKLEWYLDFAPLDKMSRVGDLERERVGEKQCLHPLSPSLALPVFALFAKMSSSMRSDP